MIDYVKTIIYKIYCKNVEITDTYVGHTTNLKHRKIEHKYACNNSKSKSYNIKVYEFIRNNGGWDNWDFIEVEKFPCNSKDEAHMRESYWYFLLRANLNSIAPSLDFEKQKIRENRKRVINQLTAYFNKIRIKTERQKYLTENAELIEQNKLKVRKNYEIKNRERINEKMREYNKKTKDRRRELAKIYYEKRKSNGYYNKSMADTYIKLD